MPSWLAALDDSERVQAALTRVVPDLRRAKLSGLRLKRGKWRGRCAILLDDREQEVNVAATIVPPGHGDPPSTTPSSTQPGTEGWRCWIPELRLLLKSTGEADSELPALRLLTDPERARALLEEAIQGGAPAYRDMKIVSVQPKVVRYSPGSRCTVLFRLDLPPEAHRGRSWPDVVVAKTYHRSDKGRIAWNGMRALWNSPLARSGIVQIAEPLAWLPKQTILLQSGIEQEQTLKELLLNTLSSTEEESHEELGDYLVKTAVGLAELHHSGVAATKQVTFEAELAEVREVAGRLASVLPELAGAADPLLDVVEAWASRIPADAPLPSHGSFRPAQVLLYQGGIGFIDFDGFCEAEPSLDVALFRTTVRDLAMSALSADVPLAERLERIDGLCEGFLASYHERASLSVERVALWEALDLMTNLLHSWTKVKPSRLKRAVALLLHHLERLRAIVDET